MVQHKHLLVKADIENPIREIIPAIFFVKNLVNKIDMNILHGPVAKYCDTPGNQGMTVFAIIETSHIVAHIWDEDIPAKLQLDVYSCKEFDINTVFEHIKILVPTNVQYKFLDREYNFRELF